MTSNKEDTHIFCGISLPGLPVPAPLSRQVDLLYVDLFHRDKYDANSKKRGRRKGLSLDDEESGIQNDTSFVDQGHRPTRDGRVISTNFKKN